PQRPLRERLPAAAGEQARGPVLAPGQHAHREHPGGLEPGVCFGARVDAHEDQRRLQAHRAEGAHGQAQRLSGPVPGGDHGDAAGELAQGVPESVGVDGHGLQDQATSAGPPLSRRASVTCPARTATRRKRRAKTRPSSSTKVTSCDLYPTVSQWRSRKAHTARPATASAVISSTWPKVRKKWPRQRAPAETRASTALERSSSTTRMRAYEDTMLTASRASRTSRCRPSSHAAAVRSETASRAWSPAQRAQGP